MKRTLFLTAGALILSTGLAAADAFTDAIVADLKGKGFEFIEIKRGVTQLKVEAIRGSRKLEVVYDLATGKILKREVEAAEADEIGRIGVQIDQRNRDFVDSNDDEEDDAQKDDEEDDNGGNRGSGSGSGDDDDDDEDEDRDKSGSSDDDDDDGGKSGSSDDDDDDGGKSDNSGPGGGHGGDDSSGNGGEDDGEDNSGSGSGDD